MQQERGSQPFPFLQKTFLLKHIVGVISGQQDEEQAIQALQKAGYTADQMYLFTSQQFLQGRQQSEKDHFFINERAR